MAMTSQPARRSVVYRLLLPLGLVAIGALVVFSQLVNRQLRPEGEKRREIVKAPGTITNSLGMTLAPIPAGRFLMGSMEEDADTDEKPPHSVEISESFFMGTLEVTRDEYESVTGERPSTCNVQGEGAQDIKRFPVETVSWEDAVEFCRRLSDMPEEKRSGRVYRLPSEAEWEYVCRAGTTTRFSSGDTLSTDDANFAGDKTKRGGSYPPNAWGLYDLHGNVHEWCADWYGEDYYRDSPAADPPGPDAGTRRVTRGGSWWSTEQPYWHSSASRHYHFPPTYADDKIGFRVLCRIRGSIR